MESATDATKALIDHMDKLEARMMQVMASSGNVNLVEVAGGVAKLASAVRCLFNEGEIHASAIRQLLEKTNQ